MHKDSPRNSYGKTLSTREPIAYGKRKPSFVKLSVQPYHIIVARTYWCLPAETNEKLSKYLGRQKLVALLQVATLFLLLKFIVNRKTVLKIKAAISGLKPYCQGKVYWQELLLHLASHYSVLFLVKRLLSSVPNWGFPSPRVTKVPNPHSFLFYGVLTV